MSLSEWSEQLTEIENPTPLFKEPEDDIDLETSAKVVDFEEENKDAESYFEQEKSSLRLQNAALLDDQNSRYAGKKTSRRQIEAIAFSDSHRKDQFDDETRGDGDEQDLETDEDEEHTLKEFRAQLAKSALSKTTGKDMDEEDDDDDDNDDDDNEMARGSSDISEHVDSSEEEGSFMDAEDEDENESADERENEDDSEEPSDELGTAQIFSKMHLTEDAERGTAVKSQLRLWDALLECRIKLQKVLLNANQLPQHDVWPLFSKQGRETYQVEARKSQQSIKSLLDAFVELQALLLAKNLETKKMLKTKHVSNRKEESDEEIPSDTEEDEADAKSDGEDNISLKRKLKVHEYPEFLKKRRMDLLGFRNNTIQKWNDKTKVSSGKVNKSFSSFEQSALKQIDQILQDEDRLVRRTQLKRSSYELLGKDLALDIDNGQGQTVSGQEAVLKQDFHLKDHDSEIFDDNDFYHQLLRELIERKTVDIQDPVDLGRQWLEIQRMRSKMKKKIDTRASKGRKIRYDVHSKLINFMAPVDECSMEAVARNTLFGALFGRRSQRSENMDAV